MCLSYVSLYFLSLSESAWSPPQTIYTKRFSSVFLWAKLIYELVCPFLTHSVTGVIIFLFWPITQQLRFAHILPHSFFLKSLLLRSCGQFVLVFKRQSYPKNIIFLHWLTDAHINSYLYQMIVESRYKLKTCN